MTFDRFSPRIPRYETSAPPSGGDGLIFTFLVWLCKRPFGSRYPAERREVELWMRRPTVLARRWRALRAGRAREVFFKRCLAGSIPSLRNGPMANDAAGNVIKAHPHKRRIARFDDWKEIASIRGVRCELSTAARFWLAHAGQEQTISPQLNYGGRNHEKNAINHCLGSSGVVCVGTDPTAAADEDARRAEAAAANHKHDHHRHRY